MKRRSFFKGLGLLAALAATNPKVLIEPKKKKWGLRNHDFSNSIGTVRGLEIRPLTSKGVSGDDSLEGNEE